MLKNKRAFLKAGWYNLVMANYQVAPELLAPYVPFNTELDFWNNKTYVSLVGFKFADTTVLGMKFPWHINFEEVNLRFYVRCKDKEGCWKRGVVFIKEIVPRHMISLIANSLYNEKYITLPMKHVWSESIDHRIIEYHWKFKDKWNYIKTRTDIQPKEILPGSEEEFITEHYWGYTGINAGCTGEYAVEHPRWNVYDIHEFEIHCDFKNLYGEQFEILNRKPDSVLVADGSEILVRMGTRIK